MSHRLCAGADFLILLVIEIGQSLISETKLIMAYRILFAMSGFIVSVEDLGII